MGFTDGERTTRRAVAQVKNRLRAGQRRVFRPWIPRARALRLQRDITHPQAEKYLAAVGET